MPAIRIDTEQYTRAVSDLCDEVADCDNWAGADHMQDLIEAAGGTAAVVAPRFDINHDDAGTLITMRPNALLLALLEAVED